MKATLVSPTSKTAKHNIELTLSAKASIEDRRTAVRQITTLKDDKL